MTACEVIVIGDVMNDIIVRPDGPLARGTDRRASIRALPGGSGANVAAWLGSLGVNVSFIGRVGSADRTRHAAALSGCGVAPFLAADHDVPTGALVTLVDPDGERSFLTERGANARLAREDLPDALLPACRMLHVSGYALFEPGPRAAVLAFVTLARERGAMVAFDAASAGFLADCGAAAFLARSRGADLLFANADEAALLTGRSDPELQLDALAPLFGLVVVKCGANGAIAARGTGRWRIPAVTACVVDTSGAGDAFAAGFLDAMLRGGAPADCLAAGAALGARAVAQVGGRPVGRAGPDVV